MLRTSAIALLVCLLSLPAALAQDLTPFDRMDVFDLEWVEDPQISPDGEQVVYVRRGMDIMKDRRTSALWMMNVDGTGHEKLTSRETDESSPQWSPDGTRIAFTSSTDDAGTEIFIHYVDRHVTAKITQLEKSPSGITWSPDGEQLAFSMLVPESEPQLVSPPDAPEGAEWADPPRVETRLNHELDGVGVLDYGFDHLFVVSAEGGAARQVTSGDFHHSSRPEWTPDGEHLIFSANRHADWTHERRNTELYSVAVEDGTIEQLTDRFGPNHTPRVSPDGQTIAYIGYEDEVQTYQVTHLYLMDLGGSNVREVTGDFDRSINDITWDENGDGLYVQYDDEGNSKLGHVAQDGTLTEVAGNMGGTSIGRPYSGSADFSVAADGTIALNQTTPFYPAELGIVPRGGEVELISDLNGGLLSRRDLGTIEELRYTSTKDGLNLHGWVVKPPGYDEDRAYPLMVEIHGGPITNYGDRFAPEILLYAAAGYVVFYPNARGSTSYGEAFGNELYNDFSGGEYQDIMDGVDRLVADGVVSEDSLYVTGGSAGGTSTAWIVGQTNRFQAAAVQKPVMNWISKTLAADNWYGYANYRYPGWAWENPMAYWEVSPISLAATVETPTMLILGAEDLRTPTWEAKQLYHALQQRKVDTIYVELPGSYHFMANRPSQLIAKVDHILAWFERYR
ncbi:MAG: prolyl oligopeptidase family serine peptidase [Bacteroidetes bacterium]|jgi:dipeptidyl aminopeptidase/acylaminoacyl peptidase|nr:prolyl oligopeptidase family serine peptidase [Bacteroidota bacterium]